MSAAATTNFLPSSVTSHLVLVTVCTTFWLAAPVKAEDTSGPLPDLIAYTGQVFTTSFQSHPVYGHPGARVQVSSQTGSSNTDLPAWLLFDHDRKSLEGVPIPRDQGTLLVTIHTECLPRDTNNTSDSCKEVSNQFHLEVQPLSWAPIWAVNLNSAKSTDVTGIDEDGSQSCEGSNVLLTSLVLCVNLTDTTSRERLELIRNLASFLSISVTSILLGSSSHGFLAVSRGFHMITAAGSGSEEVCSLVEMSELVWVLPCSTLSHLPDFTQVLQHNMEAGRLGEELGVRLDGWYVASSSSHFGRPRRRRAPSRQTLASTPILTALVPETVAAGADDYFQVTSFADTTQAVKDSYTRQSDQSFSEDVESSTTIDFKSATHLLTTRNETSSRVFTSMSPRDSDRISETTQGTFPILVMTAPPLPQSSFRSATSLQPSPSLRLEQSSTEFVSLIATRVVQVVAILLDPSHQSRSALQPSTSDNEVPKLLSTFPSKTSTTSALHPSQLFSFMSSLGPGLKDCDDIHSCNKQLSDYKSPPLQSHGDIKTEYAWLPSKEEATFIYETSDLSPPKAHILSHAVSYRLEVKESGSTREQLIDSNIVSQDYTQQSLSLQTSQDGSKQILDDVTYITSNTEYLDTSTSYLWRAEGDFSTDTTDLSNNLEHDITAVHCLTTATDDLMTLPHKITTSTENVLTLLEDLITLIEDHTSVTESTMTVSESRMAATGDRFSVAVDIQGTFKEDELTSTESAITILESQVAAIEDVFTSMGDLTTLLEDQIKFTETTTPTSESPIAATVVLFASTDAVTTLIDDHFLPAETTTTTSESPNAVTEGLFASTDAVTTLIDDHFIPTETTTTVSEGFITAEESFFTQVEYSKSLTWDLLESTDVFTVAANHTGRLSSVVTSDLLFLLTSFTLAPSSVDVTSYSATSSTSFFAYDETTTTSSVDETTTTSSVDETTSLHTIRSFGMNRSPSFHHSLGAIIGHQGTLMRVSIPRHTFVDPEDGDTRSLSLSLTWPSREEISGDFWLSLDKDRQMLMGLSLPWDVGPANLTVLLVARDSGGLTATAPLAIHVQESNDSSYTHEFVMTFASNFNDYSENRMQLIELIHRIGDYFGPDEAQFIRVLDMRPGSFLLSWTNTSLSGTVCPLEAIRHVMDHMTRKDGYVKSSFKRHLEASALLTDIRLQLRGACYSALDTTTLLVTTTRPVTDTGQSVVQGVNVWAHVITPVAVAIFVFLFIILLIVFCNRRRRRRRQSRLNIEKEAVSNDRNPIIYPDELDIDDSSPKPRQPRTSHSGSLHFEQNTVPSDQTGVEDTLLTTEKSENAPNARRPSYISVNADIPSNISVTADIRSDIIVTERRPSDISVANKNSSNVSVAVWKSSQGTSPNSLSIHHSTPPDNPDRTKTPSDIHRKSQSPVDIPLTPKTPLDIPSSTVSQNMQAEERSDSRDTEHDPGADKVSPLDQTSDLSSETATDPLRSSNTCASLDTPAPDTADYSDGLTGAEDETQTERSVSIEGGQPDSSRHSLPHPPLYKLPPPYVTTNNITRV